jgi:hypothetical protein
VTHTILANLAVPTGIDIQITVSHVRLPGLRNGVRHGGGFFPNIGWIVHCAFDLERPWGPGEQLFCIWFRALRPETGRNGSRKDKKR